MPIILILLIAALVAAFGFWDTLAGILGAVGIFVLLAVLVVALVVAGVVGWARRSSRRG